MTVAAVHQTMAACEEANDWSPLTQLWEQMSKDGRMDPSVCHAVLAGCEKGALGPLAADVVDAMRKHHVSLTSATYELLFRALDASGHNQLVVRELRQLEALTPVPLDAGGLAAVVGALAGAAQLDAAFRIVAKAEADSVVPTAATYAALLRACKEAAQATRAREVLALMDERGVPLTTECYTELLALYADQWEVAERYFNVMRAQGIPRDAATYNRLLVAYAKGHRADRMREAFDAMQAEGIAPTTHTYNAMLLAPLELDAISDVLKQMVAQGCAPDVRTYTMLIQIFTRLRSIDRAFRAFETMKARGLRPDAKTFVSLIQACAVDPVDPVSCARDVFALLPAHGVVPTVRHYTALIAVCFRAGQPEVASEVLEAMRSEGIRGTCVTYSAVIFAFAKARQLDQAKEHYQEMLRQGLEPNEYTFSALMHACERSIDVQEALRVFDDMTGRGLVPNHWVYNALLMTCSRTGQWALTLKYFDRMTTAGLQPTVLTYGAVMFALQQKRDWTTLLELYDRLTGQQLVPNYFILDLVLAASIATGDGPRATRAFLDAGRYGRPPHPILVNKAWHLVWKHERQTLGAAGVPEAEWSSSRIQSNYPRVSDMGFNDGG